MKNRVVAADSTSCLDFIEKPHNIEILPLYLHLQGERLRDVIDINALDFIRWMHANPKELPYSSPPQPEDIYALYDRWVARGIKEAILITLSSAISKTYQRALLAAQKYRDRINIVVFDSHTTLYGQAMLALEAEKLMRKNIPLQAVIAQLEFMRTHSQLYFTVGTLDYLVKNGRLSATRGFLGKMLQIKPVLYFDKMGRIVQVDKVRRLRGAQRCVFQAITDFIGEHAADIYIMRSLDKDGQYFEEMVKKAYSYNNVISLPPSPVIACHTGPVLYGFGAYLTY